MIPIIALIFFVFGLIIGSFLNVVILRYNTDRSFGGRSVCLSCQKTLRPHELIPLVSYLVLRGRCLTCKTRISIQYPLVELTTGLLFAGLFLKFQDLFFISTEIFTLTYAYYAALFALLIVISIYDLRHKIIPDTLVFIFIAIAFSGVFLFNNFIFSPHWPSLLDILSGVLIALPFALLWLVSGGTWMGLGDAKLALGLGYFLGLSQALSGLVIAFWAGALIGLLLLVLSKESRGFKMKSEIPFAPFLVLGAIATFLFEINVFPMGL